ncbi:hypothetical protein MKX03_005256 [Papaver bracteatum]|nr:hypothetical protein MKX03_005256 [Papaver bracteatum]
MAAEEEFMLYNSMKKQKEKFIPKIPGKVGMYVCGVTAYALSHIGHAHAYVTFDVLYRYLTHLGYDVTYVRNFTDVDDKQPLDLSRRFCQEYLKDMEDLQVLVPTHQPRVSEHIDQIVDMIAKVINNGCAYVVDGDVYFSIHKVPNYGRLSGQNLDDNLTGGSGRVQEDVTLKKQIPVDFALWKAAKREGEIKWASPWGYGRPGWHVECSAMSDHYLTSSFDIHGGGMDLIFPHHENELALNGVVHPSACEIKYWVHNGYVKINDEKMSKSLGNFLTIPLRYFIMSTHYRSPINYSTNQLEVASGSVLYLYQTLHDCAKAVSTFRENNSEAPSGKSIGLTFQAQECIDKLRKDFYTKMSDDLRTRDFLDTTLQDTLKLINSSLNVFSEQFNDKALIRAGLERGDVISLIEERTQARKAGNYERSDQIREDLKAKGIALLDVGDQTAWRPMKKI